MLKTKQNKKLSKRPRESGVYGEANFGAAIRRTLGSIIPPPPTSFPPETNSGAELLADPLPFPPCRKRSKLQMKRGENFLQLLGKKTKKLSSISLNPLFLAFFCNLVCVCVFSLTSTMVHHYLFAGLSAMVLHRFPLRIEIHFLFRTPVRKLKIVSTFIKSEL
jgi:hypothetical protein